jgi:Spy/CpxP family protein refolding chaperone
MAATTMRAGSPCPTPVRAAAQRVCAGSSHLSRRPNMCKPRGFILLALLTLGATVSYASPSFNLPPGRWWENQRLAEHIQLSEDQQKAIRELVYEHAQRMIDLNAAVERTKLTLENEVKQESFDPSEVRKAFVAFQDARRTLELERFEMLLAVRQLLSQEQWDKLMSLRERLEQHRQRRERPAGPPRRPGGNGP